MLNNGPDRGCVVKWKYSKLPIDEIKGMKIYPGKQTQKWEEV